MNLNIAFLDNPFLAFTNENGISKCRSPFIDTYLDYYRQIGFNVSIKAAKPMGKLQKDGHYNGVIGLVERNESNTAFLPIPPITTFNEPTLYGPIITDTTNVIHSFTRPVHFEVADIISSLNAFDLFSLVLILLLFVICFFLLKFVSKEYRIFHFISMFTGQWFPDLQSNKFIFLVIIVFIDYVDSIINVNFSTDLAVSVPPKYMRTLEDIFDTNAKPFFLKGAYFYDYVAMSGENEFVALKKIIKKYGDEILILPNDLKKFMEIIKKTLDGSGVLLLSLKYTNALLKLGCVLGKPIMDRCIAEQRNYYRSDPLASQTLAYPLSRNSSDLIKTKLTYAWYGMAEFSILNKFISGIEDMMDIADYPFACVAYFSSLRKAENDYTAIPFNAFKTTFRLTLTVYGVAMIVMLVERRVTIPFSRQRRVVGQSTQWTWYTNFHQHS